jgi:GAF domain-containing protein
MMADHSDALAASVTAISRFYVGDTTLEETLRRVADFAHETIAGADIVGVTMLVDGGPRTTVFADGSALEIDNAQYESGTGPGLVALRSQKVQRVDSMERDLRWPAFSQAAASRGILSSLSLPLIVHGEGIGALNCYSRTGGAFSPEDEVVGSEFAAAAAIALANAQAYWDARHLSERIGYAMQSQATIEQAKGILIAERRCQPDEALEILVRASHRENRKLRDIADQIVSHCWQAIETVNSQPGEIAAEQSR